MPIEVEVLKNPQQVRGKEQRNNECPNHTNELEKTNRPDSCHPREFVVERRLGSGLRPYRASGTGRDKKSRQTKPICGWCQLMLRSFRERD
jgi:hypothetical protein